MQGGDETFACAVSFRALPSPGREAHRADIATRTIVSEIRQAALTLPISDPATFELPPARRRYGTGISMMRSPLRAACICISMFQP